EREFGDLLTPGPHVGNVPRLIPQAHPVQPASLIGEVVPIRHVEHGELVVSAQAWQPLGRLRPSASMMLVIEQVGISTPSGRYGMDRARSFAYGHPITPISPQSCDVCRMHGHLHPGQ